MNKRYISLLAAFTLGLAGCADQSTKSADPVETYESAAANPFIATNYKAADALIAQLGRSLSPAQPLIVATVVDINNLDKSSALGRTVSEHVSAQFTRKGYSLVELKLRNSVYMKRTQGELMLSREIKDVAQSYNSQAVIVGTYSESSNLVFINLKVVRPDDNVILAVQDYVLPLDKTIRSLLASRWGTSQ